MGRMVLIGESSLHRATTEFVVHYPAERNHQGLGNKIIRPEFAEFPNEGPLTLASGSADCSATITNVARNISSIMLSAQ
jgi:hypothetical protein